MRKLVIAALTVVALAFTVPQIVRSDGFNTVSDLTSVSSDICVANANGACLQNEAASTTNPTVIPDKTDPDTGVGVAGGNSLSLIAGGAEIGRVNDQGITVQTGGARLRAVTPNATQPNILPVGAADNDTGIGWAGADHLTLIAGGATGLNITTLGVTGSTATLDSLTVNSTIETAQLDVIHTATEVDDHALEIVVDAAGFGDVKGLDIDYITGAIAAGSEDSIILVNIDESASTGGEVHALEVLSTTGNATIEALHVGVGVAPLHQSVGTFGDMDSALVLAVDRLTEFTSTDSDIVMFVADNDTITIGDAAQFGEIEFLLDTVASGAGVKPTFEFSTTVDAWQAFVPTDGTNGFRNTGIIDYDPDNLSGWIVGTGGEFLIRITRTANGLGTTPIENLVQIAATTSFTWNAAGSLLVSGLAISATGIVDLSSSDTSTTTEGLIFPQHATACSGANS